jgi:hypothetical protein
VEPTDSGFPGSERPKTAVVAVVVMVVVERISDSHWVSDSRLGLQRCLGF